METLFDPLRKIQVPATPEEQVRQWFITVLMDSCRVPQSLMKSEVGFCLAHKQFRADILIWDRNAAPLAVVECKRPSVALTQEVLDQAIRYNMALDLKWIILTNGQSTVVFHKNNGAFAAENKLPDYDEMLK